MRNEPISYIGATEKGLNRLYATLDRLGCKNVREREVKLADAYGEVYETWATPRGPFLVHVTYKGGKVIGWNAYRAISDSIRVDETMSDLENYLLAEDGG